MNSDPQGLPEGADLYVLLALTVGYSNLQIFASTGLIFGAIQQPKPRVNLTRYHGVLAPNHRWRGLVTPARRGKGIKSISNAEVRTPAERHTAMTWAQRLKRVFSIDIEVCARCGGSAKVIACIEDQDVIDRILNHLRQKEQETPTRPLLVPPTRAPPGTLPLFAGKDSSTTALHQQGSQ